MKTLPGILIAGLLALALPALADIQTQPVQFKKGSSEASIKGSLKGDTTIDYVLRAKAGQTMHVLLTASNSSTYFNVLPPGSDGEAIFIGSSEANEWTGVLPSSGEYKVRTYLMRNAARRNERSDYSLVIGIAATGASQAEHAVPPPAAQGNIPCSESRGQPMRPCSFEVTRESGGTASVQVTLPSGKTRVIFFDKGQAIGADLSQADGDMSFSASKEVDLFRIQAGHERYEIPEAVVFGG
jgi:hypothetical protein